jgi:hypothetical protein
MALLQRGCVLQQHRQRLVLVLAPKQRPSTQVQQPTAILLVHSTWKRTVAVCRIAAMHVVGVCTVQEGVQLQLGVWACVQDLPAPSVDPVFRCGGLMEHLTGLVAPLLCPQGCCWH